MREVSKCKHVEADLASQIKQKNNELKRKNEEIDEINKDLKTRSGIKDGSMNNSKLDLDTVRQQNAHLREELTASRKQQGIL